MRRFRTLNRPLSGLAICIAFSTMLSCSPSPASDNVVQPQGPTAEPKPSIGLPVEWTPTPAPAPTATSVNSPSAVTSQTSPPIPPTATLPPSSLAIEDLPLGFEETTPQSVGLDLSSLSGRGFVILDQSTLRHRDHHLTVVSIILELENEDSQHAFDQAISSTDEATQVFLIELGFSRLGKSIEYRWYRPRGNVRLGLGNGGDAGGRTYIVDLGVFRLAAYGRVVLLMRPEGAPPDLLNISELSDKLEAW